MKYQAKPVLLADDLLISAEVIGAYLGLTERKIFQLHRRKALPTFKLGALIACRKSELNRRLSADAA